MLQIDLGTLRDLLIIGIALFLAAIIGGGLDATGFFKIPRIRDWRVQLGVAAFGALLMTGSVLGFSEAEATLDEAKDSAQWEQSFERLREGSAGLPHPPKWSPQYVSDELEDITVGAGDDLWKNCEVAAFVRDHAARLPYLVTVKIKNSTTANSPALQCFRQLVEDARDDASARNGPGAVSSRPDGALPSLFASNDLLPILDELRLRARAPIRLAASEIAPSGPTTDILEAAATVGERGWMFLGTNVQGRLGDDRTIVDSVASVGGLIETRLPVNLREGGDDGDYRRHRVEAVVPSGARLLIESMSPADSEYRWARVRIVALAT